MLGGVGFDDLQPGISASTLCAPNPSCKGFPGDLPKTHSQTGYSFSKTNGSLWFPKARSKEYLLCS